jgi:glycogen debranching enzyme
MEPGKIPHEIRQGELATLGLRPQHPYYGTHDATSLFVLVLSHRYHWTGDVRVLERYLPAAEAAMAWIDHHGDRDGDGFQEYGRRAPGGFANQGWKDATDAIVDAMGEPASLPIATCELQGYAYDARLRLAEIHDVLGNAERAGELRAAAARLYDRVNDAFWWEREGTYAHAGHLLLSGIVPPDRARRVAVRLLADDMWSGWGIRTLSAAHPHYNPLSYHTGSVWPHDNAIIAAGLRRYGLDAEAARVARAIFDAAAGFPMHRLPELWSGLPRDGGAVPVPYRRASAPQAWAAASVFQLVTVMCGIDARGSADGGRALYVDPALPDWLPALTITNLRAGRGVMDLEFRDGSVDVLANTTGYRVIQAPAPRPEPHG